MHLPLIALTTFALLVAPSVAAAAPCTEPAFSPPGSQERIGISKMQVAEHALELPTDLVHAEGPLRLATQAAYPASPLPPTNTTIIQRAPWPGWSGALGGLAVVLGAACLRRRRRGRDHDPRYR